MSDFTVFKNYSFVVVAVILVLEVLGTIFVFNKSGNKGDPADRKQNDKNQHQEVDQQQQQQQQQQQVVVEQEDQQHQQQQQQHHQQQQNDIAILHAPRAKQQLASPCRQRANTYVYRNANSWYAQRLPVLSFVSEAPAYGQDYYKDVSNAGETFLFFIFATVIKRRRKYPIMKGYVSRATFTCVASGTTNTVTPSVTTMTMTMNNNSNISSPGTWQQGQQQPIHYPGSVVGEGCKEVRTFIVKCPLANYSITELVVTPHNPNDAWVKPVVYNVTEQVQCLQEERKEQYETMIKKQSQQQQQQQKQTSQKTIVDTNYTTTSSTTTSLTTNNATRKNETMSIAQCLIVHGWKARAYLKRNIAYHRLLGIDHAFVYIHDDSSNMDGLPLHYPPHVMTYIPTDFMSRYIFRQAAPGRHYQQSQLTDCLMRCRMAGFDYVLLADVDEFVQVVDNTEDHSNTTTSKTPTNKTTLPQLPDFLLPYKYHMGVTLHTYNYPPLNQSYFDSNFVDWIWRERNLNGNTKVFANVGRTYYHSVHAITGFERTNAAATSASLSDLNSVVEIPGTRAVFNHLREVHADMAQWMQVHNLTDDFVMDSTFSSNLRLIKNEDL